MKLKIFLSTLILFFCISIASAESDKTTRKEKKEAKKETVQKTAGCCSAKAEATTATGCCSAKADASKKAENATCCQAKDSKDKKDKKKNK